MVIWFVMIVPDPLQHNLYCITCVIECPLFAAVTGYICISANRLSLPPRPPWLELSMACTVTSKPESFIFYFPCVGDERNKKVKTRRYGWIVLFKADIYRRLNRVPDDSDYRASNPFPLTARYPAHSLLQRAFHAGSHACSNPGILSAIKEEDLCGSTQTDIYRHQTTCPAAEQHQWNIS